MYTLRLFKDNSDEIEHVYLGDCYTTKTASKEDAKHGMKLRVYGNWDSKTKEGICVYNDDNAYVMTALGLTFETVNRPKASAPDRKANREEEIIMEMQTMCEESLDPKSFEKWEDVKDALYRTRTALKTSG